MRIAFAVALSVPLLLQQTPPREESIARTAAAAAIDSATDPSACATALRIFTGKRQQEVRTPTGLTAALMKQVDEEKIALGKTCVTRFSLSSNPLVLPGMAELYVEMGLLDEARGAVTAALGAQLPPASRASVLAAAVTVGLRDAKGDERNARLEKLIDELDANAATTLDQRWYVHSRMENYYRGDDIDAGIIKHARWMAETSKTLTADQRKQYGRSVVSSQVNMAEALAGQGMNDEALALLRRTKEEWTDIPRIDESYIAPAIERYSLVGTLAAPIKASTWINAPSDMKEMPLKELSMTGAVTLLEFTAHWCGPCRESYPGVNRLRAQFGSKGFRVVMATRFWGYFSSPGKLERDISRDDEYQRDVAYFKEYQLDVPVAIGDRITTKFINDAVTYVPGPDPNETAYKVSGIPQIHLIDRKGRIRLIMIGYDDANEPKLAGIVAKLVAES